MIVLALIVAAVPLGLTAFLGYFWVLSGHFPQPPYDQPSRLYSRVTTLEIGQSMSPEKLAAALEARDYRRIEGEGPLPLGGFRTTAGHRLEIRFPPFPTPAGTIDQQQVEIVFEQGKLAAFETPAGRRQALSLEPVLLASYYTPEVEERRPVRLEEVPEHVVQAILAAEDEGYFRHLGLSVSGIARALWVNLQTGQVRQGGSTITQQLVKNLYLTHERSFDRKAREALLAILLEQRYTKEEILEAYLNEIYWGASGSVNLIGLGAAAHAYFGKAPSELTLGEAAILAGMIQAPADYSPVAHPEAARERRDWVLHRLQDLGKASQEEISQALEKPIAVDPRPAVRRRAGHFAEAAREEAARRFGLDELGGAGYLLFSTLDWDLQRSAEAAVAEGLTQLDRSWEKGKKDQFLQAALISVEPATGRILAYVGGRSFEESQFDRVSQARRQAGSAFKPIVYATAFSQGGFHPASRLEDSPILVRFSTTEWRPRNHSRRFQGTVTARTALEQSLNVPAVRLGIATGVSRVAEVAGQLGVTTKLPEVPSMVLGAVAVSPREMATVYATLANLGARPALHALDTVLEPDGSAASGDPLPSPERVLDARTAYLVTSLLQGVLDRGTGAGVRRMGLRDPLAGKTGTSNDRRDNWFAGYSPDRATVVWVGYDDNLPTRMSGARAALPIWARFTAATRPAGGYAPFERPAGLTSAVIDPQTGELATEWCPRRQEELFSPGNRPVRYCHLHRYQLDEQEILEDPNFLAEWQPGVNGGLEEHLNGDGEPAVDGAEPEPGEISLRLSREQGEQEPRPLPKLKMMKREDPAAGAAVGGTGEEPAEPATEEEAPVTEKKPVRDNDIPPVFTRRAYNTASLRPATVPQRLPRDR